MYGRKICDDDERCLILWELECLIYMHQVVQIKGPTISLHIRRKSQLSLCVDEELQNKRKRG